MMGRLGSPVEDPHRFFRMPSNGPLELQGLARDIVLVSVPIHGQVNGVLLMVIKRPLQERIQETPG